ncbi:hypothetical protein [Pseudomonas sp. NPDC089534]|uniref:hypothetical protein n=1 Tax=Pseudomonas sp. NPDC089534 TaxID=3364468 RepID=UPI00380634FC
MHIQDRLEFLDSLPALPVAPAKPEYPGVPTVPGIPGVPTKPGVPVDREIGILSDDETPIDPGKDSGTVGKEMVNIYLAGVSEQNRKDVDNCKLLVQNAADKLYDPINEMFEWYTYYTSSLAKLGWITQTAQVKEQIIKQSGLTMDVVAIYVIQSLLGANAKSLVELSLKAVEGIKDNEGLINIYNRSSNVGHDAKFDMSPVWQTDHGAPMMVLNCNSLDVSESTTGILWWKSKKQETAIKTAAQAVYLNTDVYGALRDEVLKKLAGAGKDYLGQLPDFG